MARCGVEVLDSRDVPRRVPAPGWPRMPASRRELRLTLIRAELHGFPVRPLPVALTGAAGTAVGLFVYRLFLRWEGRTASTGEGWMFAAIGVLAVWLVVGATPRDRAKLRLWRHYCKSRLCLCCGYDLDGLPLEDDGCTVCPECGAAWRLSTAEAGSTA